MTRTTRLALLYSTVDMLDVLGKAKVIGDVTVTSAKLAVLGTAAKGRPCAPALQLFGTHRNAGRQGGSNRGWGVTGDGAVTSVMLAA